MWISKEYFSGRTNDNKLKNEIIDKDFLKKKDSEMGISEIQKKISEEKKNEDTSFILNEMKRIGIEKLPYSYSSLKNFIDSETMDIHYNKHYKGYVKKLNDALSKKNYGDVDLEKIIKNISKYSKTIRNNAGGAFNHALFWNMLSPTPKKLTGKLKNKIDKTFGSFAEFKDKFEKTAKDRFGSGWVWLIITKRGTLKVVSTPNQDNPLMNVIKNGGFPILGLDLWEHSYYLKYQNERDKYIKNFWEVVNWDFVSKMYEMKTNTNLIESIFSKTIITESKVEFCSPSENEKFRNLFNKNQNVKWTFRNGIDKILREVFSDNFYDKDEYEENSMPGIYDLEKEGRSVINKLNTNYSGFCILVRDINKVLNSINKPKLDFDNLNNYEQVVKTKLLLLIINNFKYRIFNRESSTFNSIMETLKKTDKLGDNRENLTIDRLKGKFGKSNVNKIGQLGSKEDMKSGIDATIIIDNVVKTSQIKPFSSAEEKDGFITVLETGSVTKYNTDWIIFTNKNKTLIFLNKNINIVDGNYVIPSKNLLYTIS